MGFAHSEMASALWFQRGLISQTLTSGNTVNSYDTGQPGDIDIWDGGLLMFDKVTMLIDVSALTAGTLTVSLRDCQTALTNANGDANSQELCSLTAISATGGYYAEINLKKIHSTDSTRYTSDADYLVAQRYQSVRAVAAGGNATFCVMLVYGFNNRQFPTQDLTALTATYPTS
jgi:hypothetical protein